MSDTVVTEGNTGFVEASLRPWPFFFEKGVAFKAEMYTRTTTED